MRSFQWLRNTKSAHGRFECHCTRCNMPAKRLLTTLIAILVLPAYCQETGNNTDIELVEEAALRRAVARPPRSSSWTRKCSARNALGCTSCNFFTGSCTQCRSPHYVKSTSGSCKCARGYYNPSIGTSKVTLKSSQLTDKFYQKSSCAPCPSRHTCGGGAYHLANCVPKPKCQGVGYVGVGTDGKCDCAHGFMLYKSQCGKHQRSAHRAGRLHAEHHRI